MNVSIILVNYNTANLLYECITSIIEKTQDVEYEIIIIDNASSDNSISLIKNSFPDLRLIENKENIGFGRANNMGAAIAKGKYLFFLNTDTILINNAIGILFDFMEQDVNLNIAACGGNLFKSDLSPNFSYSLYFPSLLNILCYRGHIPLIFSKESFNKTGKIKDVALIIGADLFIRENIFKSINGFDPLFFMYVEDSELSYRIRKLKFRIVSNPEAEIIHFQGTSSSNIFKLRTEISSYLYYFTKHHGLLTVLTYRFIELIFILIKAFIFFLSLKFGKCLEYLSSIRYIFAKVYLN